MPWKETDRVKERLEFIKAVDVEVETTFRELCARYGLSSGDLRVVELGPSGTVFQKPVTVYLPVSDAVLALGTPEVRTFDYATGRWDSVPVLAVDTVNKLVVASVQHFSTYATVPPSPVFQLQAETGGASCSESLIVRSPLAKPFAQLPAQAVS